MLAAACLALGGHRLDRCRSSGSRWRSADAETRIAELKPQVDEVQQLRRRIDSSAIKGGAALAMELAGSADPLKVLAQTTQTLPDNTHLTDFALHSHKLSFSGQSEEAAKLISLMSADPLVQGPRLHRAGHARSRGRSWIRLLDQRRSAPLMDRDTSLNSDLTAELPTGRRGQIVAVGVTAGRHLSRCGCLILSPIAGFYFDRSDAAGRASAGRAAYGAAGGQPPRAGGARGGTGRHGAAARTFSTAARSRSPLPRIAGYRPGYRRHRRRQR